MINSLEFFGFKKTPFSLTPDSSFFFLSKKHSEVARNIYSGLIQNKGVFLISGEVGTGKTLTSRVLIEKLSKHFHIAYILNPFLDSSGIVKNIAEDFGISTEGIRLDALITQIHFFLIESMKKEGKSGIVFIDEAQHLPDDALEMVRILSNLETSSKKLLQFVLVGQTELLKKLAKKNLRQLSQRIAVKAILAPLNLSETYDYIFHRLKQAGGTGKIEFNKISILQIYKLTRGYPRSINILMDNVLNCAAEERKKIVDTSLIKRAYKNIFPFPLRFLPFSFLKNFKGLS